MEEKVRWKRRSNEGVRDAYGEGPREFDLIEWRRGRESSQMVFVGSTSEEDSARGAISVVLAGYKSDEGLVLGALLVGFEGSVPEEWRASAAFSAVIVETEPGES